MGGIDVAQHRNVYLNVVECSGGSGGGSIVAFPLRLGSDLFQQLLGVVASGLDVSHRGTAFQHTLQHGLHLVHGVCLHVYTHVYTDVCTNV